MDKITLTEDSNISHIFGNSNELKISDLPITGELVEKAEKLKKLSKYPFDFDFKPFALLEERLLETKVNGGIVFKSPFRLVNSHTSCQQCLYSFEVDTYGRGCTHDCVYCYAKQQLSQHGMWNKPYPMPADPTELWKIFYTVFETDRKSKWRDVMEKRIPVRIGSMSDSFMWMDKKYKVTQELLKLLNYYKYPYIVFTRSDLVAKEPYLSLLNPELCSIQMSIASTNDDLNRKIEPGAVSSKKRLIALQTLTRNGFWTTVRLNPFFPIYADGFFTDPEFDKENMPEPFKYSSFEMVDEIASYGVQSILTGMVRLSPYAINQIEKATGRNLKELFTYGKTKSSKDFHLSDNEVRAYYERISAKCKQNGIEFTTCYIGNGEPRFWNDQDLWSNKKDCCNAINRVKAFTGITSRDIKWETRLKHTKYKCSTPNQPELLHKELTLKPLTISSSGITISEPFHV